MDVADAILKALTGYGLPGLVIGALCFWIFQMQKRLDAVHDARIEDSVAMRDQLLKYQDDAHDLADRMERAAERIAASAESMKGTRR